VHVVHASVAQGNAVLTTMLVAATLATYLGGALADRFGRRAVLFRPLAAAVPIVPATVALTRIFPQPWIGALGAALLGFAMVLPNTAFVVLGQEYLPNHLGLASGVTLGLAISLGGFAGPFLGALADARGLVATMEVVAGLIALAALAALALPADARAARPTRALAEDRKKRSARPFHSPPSAP